MMILLLFFFFFYFFCLSFTSIHVLVYIIFVEFLILFMFVFFCFKDFVFVSLIFILFAVCMGAYSVSLYLSFVRSNHSSYVMGILVF